MSIRYGNGTRSKQKFRPVHQMSKLLGNAGKLFPELREAEYSDETRLDIFRWLLPAETIDGRGLMLVYTKVHASKM
jgi:hypothetical protein